MWLVQRNEWIFLFEGQDVFQFAGFVAVLRSFRSLCDSGTKTLFFLPFPKRVRVTYLTDISYLLWSSVLLIKKKRNLHDSYMHNNTHWHKEALPCCINQRNSQAWLSALTNTVYGRRKQVASLHFSLIPFSSMFSLFFQHVLILLFSPKIPLCHAL